MLQWVSAFRVFSENQSDLSASDWSLRLQRIGILAVSNSRFDGTVVLRFACI
jgi:hypothetical protein